MNGFSGAELLFISEACIQFLLPFGFFLGAICASLGMDSLLGRRIRVVVPSKSYIEARNSPKSDM